MAANKTISVSATTGYTGAEGAANGAAFARRIYDEIPTGEAAGQNFKNEFIRTFLEISGRARKVARQVLDGSDGPNTINDGSFNSNTEHDALCATIEELEEKIAQLREEVGCN